MNAMAINPTTINVIPNPLNPTGTLLYFIFSLIPAKAMTANAKPIPEPKPNTTLSGNVYDLSTIKSDPPSIAQFTAIKGKKIPNELYNAGENFSTTISTNWTIVAIVAINIMNERKLRSYSANSGPIHSNGLGF